MISRLAALVLVLTLGACAGTRAAAPAQVPAGFGSQAAAPRVADGITTIGRDDHLLVVVNQGRLHFTLELAGRDLESAENQTSLWRIDGQEVHMYILDLDDQRPDQEAALREHVESLLGAMAEECKCTLDNVVAGAVKSPAGELWAFFSFGLPGKDGEPGARFVNAAALVEGSLVVLASPLGDEWKAGQAKLLDFMSTLRRSAEPIVVSTI